MDLCIHPERSLDLDAYEGKYRGSPPESSKGAIWYPNSRSCISNNENPTRHPTLTSDKTRRLRRQYGGLHRDWGMLYNGHLQEIKQSHFKTWSPTCQVHSPSTCKGSQKAPRQLRQRLLQRPTWVGGKGHRCTIQGVPSILM